MESPRRQPNQDQGQLASSSKQAQVPSSRPSRPLNGPPASSSFPRPEPTALVVRNQAMPMPGAHPKAARITMASLPPPPPPRGITRALSLFFTPLQPLRFFWPIARRLWLAAGLLVIIAAAADYVIDLFVGNVPTIAD